MNLHSIAYNDSFCKFLKTKKLKYHTAIIIQTLCNDKLMPPISIVTSEVFFFTLIVYLGGIDWT